MCIICYYKHRQVQKTASYDKEQGACLHVSNRIVYVCVKGGIEEIKFKQGFLNKVLLAAFQSKIFC